MEKKSYVMFLSAENADNVRRIIANITKDEALKLKNNGSPFGYHVSLTNCDEQYDNGISFLDAKDWLSTARLTRTHYVLSDVKSRVIHLPNGVQFNPEGYLEIYLGKTWDSITHDDALEELKLQEWILKTFPTAQYYKSRVKFTLPTKREEFPDKRHSVKWVFNISASGDGAIIEQKFIYKKATEII